MQPPLQSDQEAADLSDDLKAIRHAEDDQEHREQIRHHDEEVATLDVFFE